MVVFAVLPRSFLAKEFYGDVNGRESVETSCESIAATSMELRIYGRRLCFFVGDCE